ncbi:hypothetical protein BGX26_001443 [Mortierella sp. AD094]|nr:hypothetical protein BGX26_001443 [Mortierella sp. AD094]
MRSLSSALVLTVAVLASTHLSQSGFVDAAPTSGPEPVPLSMRTVNELAPSLAEGALAKRGFLDDLTNHIFGKPSEPSAEPEQPPTEQPPTEQPPTEQPPTEQPPTEQPPTEKPPAGEKTNEQKKQECLDKADANEEKYSFDSHLTK